MQIQKHDEFSVILHLDEQASRDLERVRQLMPASPYRDDPPHVTLLQGIHPSVTMSDEEILRAITPALNRLIKPEAHVRVSYLSNLTGGPYKITSAIVMAMSSVLGREHISLLAHLRGGGFGLSSNAMFYYPHASVRLGVPFDARSLELASELFPKGRGIELVSWEVLRLTSTSKRRPFHELVTK
ncbi:MAG TPA: hypothetical protein VFT49_01945 [Candidatus Saccharimonadales bacterium]|nr:hypothetical protein [Candidatus Saccharimonadales bacterium]